MTDFLDFCEKNLVICAKACYNSSKKSARRACGANEKGTRTIVEYVVEKRWDGEPVLSVIKKELGISGSTLRHLKFLEHGILVNGERVTVRRVVHEGDVLSLATEDEVPQEHLLPIDLPLSIVYEDDDVVVPSKPADMPTHPSHNHHEDTVANALAFRYRERGIPFVFRPINRLDRNTSGLLLVARNKLSAGRLTRALDRGEIRKRYLAVLDGEMTEQGGVIDACLHRTAKSIIIREVCSPNAPDADAARTEYAANDFRLTMVIDDYYYNTGIDRDMIEDNKGFETVGEDGDEQVLDGYEACIAEIDGGYTLEIMIPWACMSGENIPALVPAVGMTVGVDFGMFDLDFPCPGVATVRMQWAGTDTVDTDPSQWGSMTFCE